MLSLYGLLPHRKRTQMLSLYGLLPHRGERVSVPQYAARYIVGSREVV